MNGKKTRVIAGTFLAFAVFGAWLFTSHVVWAHCDTLDGPVVVEAKTALEKGDVTPLLKWVKEENEAEVRAAFERALAVRSKGKEAQELADLYFFETLVRVHRAGEGAPYTGLKAVEAEVEPGIEVADKALESGSPDDLIKDLQKAMEKGVKERFVKALETKKHAGDSVEVGREYVEAYVGFIHYVERLHKDIAGSAGHHGEAKEKDEKKEGEGHGHEH